MDELEGDRASCFGLCCVVLPFAKSTVHDCFGAGRRVSQVVFRGND